MGDFIRKLSSATRAMVDKTTQNRETKSNGESNGEFVKVVV